MNGYIDLDRRFRNLTDQEREDPTVLAIWSESEPLAGSPWSELLESERVVILAEAGSGKTWEMKAQAKRLNEAGSTAFFIPVEALDGDDVRGYLATEPGEAERFESWLAQAETPAWFFLDSVDELKLIHGKLEQALGKLATALGPTQRRAHILLSCRPTDWRPVQDLEIFRTRFPVSGPQAEAPPLANDDAFLAPFRERETPKPTKEEKAAEKFRCVVLLPLGKRQIETFATKSGVNDPKALMAEINRREAWTFARRPLDLAGLVATWNASGKLGTLRAQHEADIENSLRDDPDRPDASVLTSDKARDGAERLALAMLLTKNRTIRAPEHAVTEKVDATTLDAFAILTNWTDAEVKALLRRSIFDPATYGRIRFHHRSIQEFLAAERLRKLRAAGMSKRALLALLFADTYGERILIPSMRPVAAWLCNTDADVCREVLQREPEVLILQGDPETLPRPTRGALLRGYVAAYSGGGWRGLHMPVAEVQRLAKADLAPDIKAAWAQHHSNAEVPEFLMKLVWLGAIQDCAGMAGEALLNEARDEHTRMLAARALGECKRTDLLRRAADDMLVNPGHWPDSVVYTISDELFPEVITADELEQLIRRTPEPKRTVSGFTWTLYTLVDSIEPGSQAAVSLRDMLAKLVREGDATQEPYRPRSRFSYLTSALAKLCARRLRQGGKFDAAWVEAAVVAHRFHGDNVVGQEEIKELSGLASASAAGREAAFWAQLALSARHDRGPDRIALFYTLQEGLVHTLAAEDRAWLMRALKKSADERVREIALHSLIELWYATGRSKDDLKALQRATVANAALSKVLTERTTPLPPDPNLKKYEEEREQYKAQHAAQQDRVLASWRDWKEKLDADREAYLRGKYRDHSMWTMLDWLRHSGKGHSHLAHENWRTIRTVMGDEVGEAFEGMLREYWRATEPPIWSNRDAAKRNSIFNSQFMALTGLLVEASTGADWASKLTAKEARRAAEWSLLELNGTPAWFGDLAASHPRAMQAALAAELAVELKEVSGLGHPRTLNALRYGAEAARPLVAALLRRALLAWPPPPRNKAKVQNYRQNLDTVLSVLVLAGACDKAVADQCERRFRAAPLHESSDIWLQGLCACDARRGSRVLHDVLMKLPLKKRGPQGIRWLGTLFGDRDRFKVPVSMDVEASLLLDLTKLVYQYVRPADDIVHDGVYSPGPRDEAESARNRLLSALIGRPGRQAYNALRALAEEPLFAHMPDRLRLLARERAASDSETAPIAPGAYRAWENEFETPPRTRDELFKVMLNRLDDIRLDIGHHDLTDRHILAKIDNEPELQPLLARKFSDEARGQYIVVREDEVADHKKTDIRLMIADDVRAVIELKIGDKWSVSELEAMLKDQLVDQYLRHANCAAGCYLVTYAGRRQFHDPNTRRPITFEAVIERLRVQAEAFERAEGGRIRLVVEGLDLRSPLESSVSKRSRKKAAKTKRSVKSKK